MAWSKLIALCLLRANTRVSPGKIEDRMDIERSCPALDDDGNQIGVHSALLAASKQSEDGRIPHLNCSFPVFTLGWMTKSPQGFYCRPVANGLYEEYGKQRKSDKKHSFTCCAASFCSTHY